MNSTKDSEDPPNNGSPPSGNDCVPAARRKLKVAWPPSSSVGWLVVLILASTACRNPSGWLVSYQLERSFALADVFSHQTHLDLGTDPARSSLLHGWSWNETNKGGDTFVWSTGPTSSLGFFLYDLNDVVLSLRGLALETKDSPEQVVTISVGGTTLGSLPVATQFTELSLPVPESALHLGWNTFDLRYKWTRSELPSQQQKRWPRQTRDFAVAWDTATLLNAQDQSLEWRTPSASTSLVDSTLTLDADTSVEFSMEISPGSRLTIDRLRCKNCGPEPMTIEVFSGEGGDPLIRKLGTIDQQSKVLALTPSQDTSSSGDLITQTLILRAVGQGQVTLEDPVVERPAAERI